ncbi:DUF3696 domain-containing protein [uncultured Arcticibacterium sp.]|uniref:AAA family ATPase n=1 Tax=uncultured Arcticibacterium sp. TaxID=2173042 RepID=UPI0030F77FBB
MIKKIQIQNFKCFLNTSIEFNELTVLAGANGVGKSTIIQAMLLLRQFYKNEDSKNVIISINNKIDSFLELGSTQEILATESDSLDIQFKVEDSLNHSETIVFKIDKENPLSLSAEKMSTDYSFKNSFNKYLHYLNAERLGPRNTQQMSVQKDLNVGFQGEFTGQAISLASKNTESIYEYKQFPKSEAKTFEKQVEYWMQFIIPDIEINVSTYEDINQVRIGIRKKGADTAFLHPNNIGFGISYSLPIIVSALIAEPGCILIIENPEAHLHPLGQSRIGQFIAKMSNSGVQIIIETHSEHVINGVRLATKNGFKDKSKVTLNFLKSDKKLEIIPLDINENAELSEWPVGFFDQEESDLSTIFKLNRAGYEG